MAYAGDTWIRRNKMNAWVRGAVLMLYSRCCAKFFQGFGFFLIIIENTNDGGEREGNREATGTEGQLEKLIFNDDKV